MDFAIILTILNHLCRENSSSPYVVIQIIVIIENLT